MTMEVRARSDTFKTGTRPNGSTFCWFGISAGRNASGKRVQVYRSIDRRKDAKAEHARIVNEISERRFVARRPDGKCLS